MAVGIIVLGVAMRGSQDLGTRLGAVSIVLGTVALIAGSAVLVDPLSLFAALAVFALIAFHLIVGWRSSASLGSDPSASTVSPDICCQINTGHQSTLDCELAHLASSLIVAGHWDTGSECVQFPGDRHRNRTRPPAHLP